MSKPALTLYYDGNCPFCAAEMQRLRLWNTQGNLHFIDISMPGFDSAELGTDMAALDAQLHSRTATGQVLIGIDSMLAAYTLVGRGWIVAPLRVKSLRPLLSSLYRGFARNRYRFSALMGYKPVPRCDGSVCRAHPFKH